MATVLITAFDAYGEWEQNSSWLTLIELTRNLPRQPHVTTRRYPVDYAMLAERLASDLEAGYDYSLHLGQAPGRRGIELEMIGLNVAGDSNGEADEAAVLAPSGPVAYRSQLPLGRWAARIRQAGIACRVSCHAGTFLCNAVLYLAHYLAEQRGLSTRSTMIHLPLEVSQVSSGERALTALPAATMATAIHQILADMAGEPAADEQVNVERFPASGG